MSKWNRGQSEETTPRHSISLMHAMRRCERTKAPQQKPNLLSQDKTQKQQIQSKLAHACKTLQDT